MSLKTAIVFVLCFTSSLAFGSETWGLAWRAPPACIQAPELAERVERKMGRSLFAAQAERSVDGYLAEEGDGWRARFTMVDGNGKILGTRELRQSAASCRELDERLLFLVVLLIQPILDQPKPPPDPPKLDVPTLLPHRVVRKAKLEVLGDQRFADGRLITQFEFYRILRKWDLIDELSARARLKVTLGILAGTLFTASALLLGASAVGVDCARWSGTPSAPGTCLDRPPGLLISAAVLGLLATGGVVAAVASPARPTDQTEDERLVGVYESSR